MSGDGLVPAMRSVGPHPFNTGESGLRCAAPIIANATTKTNNKAWFYRYDQPWRGSFVGLGTLHAAENWEMFRGVVNGPSGSFTFTEFTPDEAAFSEGLIAYWLSFVRSFDPNTFKLDRSPVWEEYVPETRARIVLYKLQGEDVDPEDPESVGASEMEVIPGRCAFVASKADKMLV